MALKFKINPGDKIKLRRGPDNKICSSNTTGSTNHLVIFSYLQAGTVNEGIYFIDTYTDVDYPSDIGPYKELDEDIIQHAYNNSHRYDMIKNVTTYLGDPIRYAMVSDLLKYIISGTTTLTAKTLAYPNGMKCSNCGEVAHMAEPNQADGVTFICYSCRANRWR